MVQAEYIIIKNKRRYLGIMKLGNLLPGETGVVTNVLGTGLAQRRLLDLGFVRGTDISMVKHAPSGDPVEVRLRGYSIALRRSTADLVEVNKKL